MLAVEGSLDVAGPGDGFTLHADGTVLHCEVRSLGSGLALLRIARANAPTVRILETWLDLTGLCLSVRYRGRVLLEVGAGVAPTWISSRLGLRARPEAGSDGAP
jgi:hypothetical protein